jgi:hypothetical protein
MKVAPVRLSLFERAQRLHTALNAMDLDTAVAMISPSAEIRTPMGSFTGGEAYRAVDLRALPRVPGPAPRDPRARRGVKPDARLRMAPPKPSPRLSRLPRAKFPEPQDYRYPWLRLLAIRG